MEMEELDEIPIPEIEEKPHKKRKRTAVIAALCVIVLAVAITVFAVKIYSAPERAFMNGLRNMAEEMRERQELWETAAGNTEEDRKDSIKATVILNASAKELPVTLGIDTVLLKDENARKLSASTQLSVMNRKLVELNLYGDAESIIFNLPAFWEQNFAFDTGRIDEQYNASLFAEEWGELENQKIVMDFFPDEGTLSWKELMIQCREILEMVFDKEKRDSVSGFPDIRIEKLEEDIVLGRYPDEEDERLNGENIQYQCSQYRILISGIGTESKAGNGSHTSNNIAFSEDIALLAAVDENDRIVQISLEEPFFFDGMELTGKLLFLGEATGKTRSIDDIVVDLQIEVPLDVLSIDTSLLSAFGNQIAEELTEESIVIQIDAEAVYDENDTSVTVNLDELTASVDRIGTFGLTGGLTLEPLQEEVEPLMGETIRIFEITEEEYDELERQLRQKLLRWSIIGQFMS